MQPGTCLRQVRERLGLTYRDVEQSSFELASKHGRSEFVIRISRLADIENGGVTPTLHKLYTLCALYQLDVFEVCQWYQIPLDEHLRDGFAWGAKKTHLGAAPYRLRLPLKFDPACDPRRTTSLTRMVESWREFEGAIDGWTETPVRIRRHGGLLDGSAGAAGVTGACGSIATGD